MANKFRKSPPVCLFISIGKLLLGKLKLSSRFCQQTVKMEDKQEFSIFRHITVYPVRNVEQAVTFIVRFKFARLSHNGNRIASIIPMLLITGFPGFQTKIYAVNKVNGFWQGMYQWKTPKHLEEYLESFVYKMMNKRAINKTLTSNVYDKELLCDFIGNDKKQ